MEYNILLDVAAELGYTLAISGAETFRIEESISRIMDAYGVEAEVFAIPNCLHVSIETEDHIPLTRMRRIGAHGNDLDAVERYSALGRKICAETPNPEVAMGWLKDTQKSIPHYGKAAIYLAHFLGSFGFAILFGGTVTDALCAGICGLIIALYDHLTKNYHINPIFSVIISACLMALPAHLFAYLGITQNTDAVIIGALMLLVPGLLFTNAMRDIIYGDTNSGINRVVQVFLIAVSIALGTGVAFRISTALFGVIPVIAAQECSLFVQAIACFIGCTGFSLIFNIHGPGGILCSIGGVISWLVYILLLRLGAGEISAYFAAAVVASAYSEVMARVRKYPAISYLVVSIFPLIPGASTYYTMTYAVNNDTQNFVNQGMHTIAIAGIIALGILMVSTCFRAYGSMKKHAV